MGDNSQNTFPFSPSPFLGKVASVKARPNMVNALRAGVTDFYISDERGRNRSRFRNGRSIGDAAIPNHLLALLSRQKIPFYSDARKNGLRLLSLESFVWGSQGYPPQPRTRPDNTLIWVFAGGLQLDYPRQGQLIGQDSVHYVPAGTAFAAVPQPGAAGLVLSLPPALTGDTDPPFPSATLSGIAGDSGEALLKSIIALPPKNGGEDGSPESDLRQRIAVLALQLSHLRPARMPSKPARCTKVEDRPLVERFITLASARLKQGHTIGDLADELGTSAAALDQACRNARGKRAIELIHQLRLEQAVTLLRNGYHSPTQIAKELGYTSLAHFTRAFVEATGHPPESFRDRN